MHLERTDWDFPDEGPDFIFVGNHAEVTRALLSAHKEEGSQAHFDRYIAGDR